MLSRRTDIHLYKIKCGLLLAVLALAVPFLLLLAKSEEEIVWAKTAVTSPKLTASQALTNGQPTLFFFNPVEMCQIKYCLQAAWVQAQLAESGSNANFVEVPLYTVAQNTAVTPPLFAQMDWDIYPVGEFVAWLPELSLTPQGWGLWAPALVLLDGAGHLRYEGNQWDAELINQLQR